MPDQRGHFGPYGGIFVSETLIPALEELRKMYAQCLADPDFSAEFEYELKHYVGRLSPIYHARRMSDTLGGAQIYLKREDLNHPVRTRSTTASPVRSPGAWASGV